MNRSHTQTVLKQLNRRKSRQLPFDLELCRGNENRW